MEKESRIKELEGKAEELAAEINKLLKSDFDENKLSELDRVSVPNVIDYCYEYSLEHLNEKSNITEELNNFNKKCEGSFQNNDLVNEPNLSEYIELLMGLSRTNIEINYLKKYF